MPKLFVVATPIGNLNDLTPRMREALASADLIAAEDTRVTMKLLNHFKLKKPMVSCHRHNEDARAPQLVERMLAEDPMVRVLEASNKTKGSVERLGLSFYLLFVGERSPE